MSPRSFFSRLFADFLSSPTVLALADVPSLTALPRKHAESSEALPMPFVEVVCDVSPEHSSELLTLKITLRLHHIPGTEAGQTTRTQAHTWLQSLRRAMADDDAWNTWVYTLTTEQKTGFYVQAVRPLDQDTDPDAEAPQHVLTSSHEVVTFWNE